MSLVPRTSFLAAVLVAALSASASGELEVTLDNGARLTSDIAADGETERFVVDLPAGASVSVSARGRKRVGASAELVDVVIRDPEGEVVAVGEPRRTTASIKRHAVEESGLHVIEVTGPPGARYALKVAWKSSRTEQDAVTFDDGDETLVFSADEGAVVRVFAKRSKKSGATPVLRELRSLDESFSVRLDADGETTKAKGILIPETGDYEIVVGSGSAGDANVGVKIKAPRGPKSRSTLTDDALRAADGTVPQSLTGAVIGPLGGTVVLREADEATGAVTIEGGSTKRPRVVVIGRAGGPEFVLGDGNPLSPAVFVGPRSKSFLPGRVDIVVGPSSESAEGVRVTDENGETEDRTGNQIDIDAGRGVVSVTLTAAATVQVQGPTVSGGSKGSGIRISSGTLETGDQYGRGTATDGSTIVVEGQDQVDGSNDYSSVFVHLRNGDDVTFQQRLDRPTDDAIGFGSSFTLDGGRLVIGASGTLHTDDNEPRGAVFVFEQNRGVWTQTQRIETTDADPFGLFGAVLVAENGTLVIGAPDQGDIEGEVFIYRFNERAGEYQFDTSIVAGDSGTPIRSLDMARFGGAIDIKGGTIAIGAPTQDAEGSIDDDKGVAYVFSDGARGVSFVARLTPPTNAPQGFFGQSIATDGGNVIVAHPGSSSGDQDGAGSVVSFKSGQLDLRPVVIANPTPGRNQGADLAVLYDNGVAVMSFPQSDDGDKPGAGQVYCAERDQNGDLGAPSPFLAPNLEAGDAFGISIALNNGVLVIGSLLGASEEATGSGSASVFVLEE